ncbi:MAG: SGNH/GDSL hydrolase family protein [Leptospira sp.]|nr:SGNH/GDSL hydrolase family protein [Leptospira sp.]
MINILTDQGLISSHGSPPKWLQDLNGVEVNISDWDDYDKKFGKLPLVKGKPTVIMLIFLFLLQFSFCQTNSHEKEVRKDKEILFGLLIVSQQIPLDQADCTDYSQPLNSAYGSGYYQKFRDDNRLYQILFLGDSIFDIGSRYDGFYDKEKTQMLAVAGNTFCDMNTQMGVIKSQNPAVVIFGTGGNDILQHIQNQKITQSGKAFIDKISNKFPKSKIVGISVPPTRVVYANENKKEINDSIQAYLIDRGGCYVDVLSLFNVPEGQPANQTDLLEGDSIHPSKSMTFKIKDKILFDCGVNF